MRRRKFKLPSSAEVRQLAAQISPIYDELLLEEFDGDQFDLASIERLRKLPFYAAGYLKHIAEEMLARQAEIEARYDELSRLATIEQAKVAPAVKPQLTSKHADEDRTTEDPCSGGRRKVQVKMAAPRIRNKLAQLCYFAPYLR